MLQAVERPREIHAQDRLPVRRRHFFERAVANHARIIDQDIQPAERLPHLRNNAPGLLVIGNIALDDVLLAQCRGNRGRIGQIAPSGSAT